MSNPNKIHLRSLFRLFPSAAVAFAEVAGFECVTATSGASDVAVKLVSTTLVWLRTGSSAAGAGDAWGGGVALIFATSFKSSGGAAVAETIFSFRKDTSLS